MAILSVNCGELITALLAAEAVGVAAPINPALAAEPAAELVRLSGAKVIVAAGPGARREASGRSHGGSPPATGARALLALRPTGAGGAAPALEPLAGTTVAYLATLARRRFAGRRGPRRARGGRPRELHPHRGHHGHAEARGAHAPQRGRERLDGRARCSRTTTSCSPALPLFHTNALVVTLLAPLLRGLHVVWAGPLGYRDPSLFGAFWKLVERSPHRGAVRRPDRLRRARRGAGRRGHQQPADADRRRRAAAAGGGRGVPRADGRRPLRGLRPDRGHVRQRVHGPGRRAAGDRRPAPAVPGGAGRRGSTRRRAGGGCCRTARSARWSSRARTSSPAISSPGRTDRSRAAATRSATAGSTPATSASVDADGYVRLAGRAKDLIIRGGHNIDPAVIEDALLEHPAVSAAAAVGRPDAHAGEVPVAYVALAEGAATTADELRAWAAGRVPEPAAAPKRVDVVDAIPVTAVGKPFKPELRRRAAEDAARDALAGRATDVPARLDDGRSS